MGTGPPVSKFGRPGKGELPVVMVTNISPSANRAMRREHSCADARVHGTKSIVVLCVAGEVAACIDFQQCEMF